jgi:hypothetical protein
LELGNPPEREWRSPYLLTAKRVLSLLSGAGVSTGCWLITATNMLTLVMIREIRAMVVMMMMRMATK